MNPYNRKKKENKTNKQHLLLYKINWIVTQSEVPFCLKIFWDALRGYNWEGLGTQEAVEHERSVGENTRRSCRVFFPTSWVLYRFLSAL